MASGLAFGIDIHAHLGALSAHAPTIAILGSGLACIYPKEHKKIADRIVNEGGALVSEFPLLAKPYKYNFPQRNHTLAALSTQTLVIEARQKSGSLITAYAAAQEGRDVYAVPGSPLNPESLGCLELINNGAYLASTPNDLQPAPGNTTLSSKHQPQAELNTLQKKILAILQTEPCHFDLIMYETSSSAQNLRSALTQLEVLGYIYAHSAGYIKI